MIKIQNNTATREPIPKFLRGLKPESLLDLSWTDPSLGLQDAAWWPEVEQSQPLNEYERYGDETLTVDTENQQVIVTRAVVPWTQEEIDAHLEAERKAQVPESVSKRQLRQQMIVMGISDLAQPAIDAITDPMERDLVQSFWDHSNRYERYHPEMVRFISAIGFSEVDADNAFIAAAQR